MNKKLAILLGGVMAIFVVAILWMALYSDSSKFPEESDTEVSETSTPISTEETTTNSEMTTDAATEVTTKVSTEVTTKANAEVTETSSVATTDAITAETTTTVSDNEREMTYLEYSDLTPSEKEAFKNSFPDEDAFTAWYEAALEAYEAELFSDVIIGGNINIGDYIN